MRGRTVRTPERVAEAQRMRSEGKFLREIAEHFGIGVQTAHAWLTDPDGSILRERRRKYDRTCVDCGGRVDGRSPGKMANPDEPVCITCAGEHYAVWTREAIVLCIQEWGDEHGGVPPTANDFHRGRVRDRHTVPNVSHVLNRFGTWNDAIRAAGFEPHARGPLGGYTPLTPEQRAECVRRYAAGESSPAIAADIGCSPTWVVKLARRAGVPIRPAQRKAA